MDARKCHAYELMKGQKIRAYELMDQKIHARADGSEKSSVQTEDVQKPCGRKSSCVGVWKKCGAVKEIAYVKMQT